MYKSTYQKQHQMRPIWWKQKNLKMWSNNLLSIVVKNASSINKSSDNYQNQENNKSNDSKPQQPSRMYSFQTWFPCLILINNPSWFLFSPSTSIHPSKTFIFPYQEWRKHQWNTHPTCTNCYPPIEPITWSSCIHTIIHCWMPRNSCWGTCHCIHFVQFTTPNQKNLNNGVKK